jgi:hypothetical protein
MIKALATAVALAISYTLLYLMIAFCTWHFWSPQELLDYMNWATPSNRFDWMVVGILFAALPFINWRIFK